MNKPTDKEVEEFLRESNAIEGIYDEQSFKDAKEAWYFLSGRKVLTRIIVKETHRLLMQNQEDLSDKTRGHYRRCPIYIGGRPGLEWTDIPEAIDSWLKDVRTSIKLPGKNGEHMRLDHIEYERIHPFVDGNGRTGRMFYNWQRLRAGLPLHIIHAGAEQMEYYKWFK